jgi:hypothetical protein
LIDAAVAAVDSDQNKALARIAAVEAKILADVQAAADERIKSLLASYATFLTEARDEGRFERETKELLSEFRQVAGVSDQAVEQAIAKATGLRREASRRIDDERKVEQAAVVARRAVEVQAVATNRIESIIADFDALLNSVIDQTRIVLETEKVLRSLGDITGAPDVTVDAAIVRINRLSQTAIDEIAKKPKAEETRRIEEAKTMKLKAAVEGIRVKYIGQIDSAKTPAAVRTAFENAKRQIEQFGSESEIKVLVAPLLLDLEAASAKRLTAIKVAENVEAKVVEAQFKRSVDSLASIADRIIARIGELVLPAGLEELVTQGQIEVSGAAARAKIADRAGPFLAQIEVAAAKKRELFSSSVHAKAGAASTPDVVEPPRKIKGKGKRAEKGTMHTDPSGSVVVVPAHKNGAKASSTKVKETDLERAIRLSLAGHSAPETWLERAIRLSLEEGDAVVDIDNRPGRLGIRNLGATCYLAASVQLLAHSPQLMKIVLRDEERMRKNPISSAFFDMVSMMWRDGVEKEFLDPTALLAELHAYRERQI